MGRKESSKALRRALFKEQCELCVYCGCKVSMEIEHRFSPHYATVDHITPWGRLCRNEKDRERNQVVTCYRCNNLKNDLPLLTFMARWYPTITGKEA